MKKLLSAFLTLALLATLCVGMVINSSATTSAYVKITQIPEDINGKYLIVWGSEAHATVTNKDLVATAAVTVNGDQIAVDEATTEIACVTITGTADACTVLLPNGYYLSTLKNSAAQSESEVTLKMVEDNGGITLTDGTYYYYCNSGSYYRAYVAKTSSSYVVPTFYKLTEVEESESSEPESSEPESSEPESSEPESSEPESSEPESSEPEPSEPECDIFLNFKNNESFNTWNTSYSAREIEFDDAVANFTSANKQNATASIPDMPVTKGQPVTVTLKDTSKKITGINFKCAQWGTKTQTITLSVSTDGVNFEATAFTADNFNLIANYTLEDGIVAVKFEFSSTSNQVGIEYLALDVAQGEELAAAPVVISLGAKINLSKSALRLGASYDGSQLTKEERATIEDIGLVMYPASKLGESVLDLNNDLAARCSAFAIEGYVEGYEFSDYEGFTFYATIVNIPESGYGTLISFRPYVIYNGTASYGEVLSKSILSAAEYATEAVSTPEENVSYKLGYNNNGTVYYANGAMSGYYGGYTTSVNEAVTVTVIEDHDEYAIITSEGKYVCVSVSGTYYNFVYSDNPDTSWSYTGGSFSTEIDGVTVVIGSKGSYKTIGAYADGSCDYPLSLYSFTLVQN